MSEIKSCEFIETLVLDGAKCDFENIRFPSSLVELGLTRTKSTIDNITNLPLLAKLNMSGAKVILKIPRALKIESHLFSIFSLCYFR